MQSAPNAPPPKKKKKKKTQGIGHQKYATDVHCSTPSPKCLSVLLYDQPSFQDIAHFRIFPLTSMLKFQRATKFVFFADH